MGITMTDRLRGWAQAQRSQSIHRADSWPPGVLSILENVLRTVCRPGPETLTRDIRRSWIRINMGVTLGLEWGL